MPSFAVGGRCSGVCSCELHGADPDDGGDLVGERHVLAGGDGAVGDEAVEGRADGGVGEGLFGLRELARARLRATAWEFSTAPQLWRAPLSAASYCWRAALACASAVSCWVRAFSKAVRETSPEATRFS